MIHMILLKDFILDIYKRKVTNVPIMIQYLYKMPSIYFLL